jgi:hypothetical protein
MLNSTRITCDINDIPKGEQDILIDSIFVCSSLFRISKDETEYSVRNIELYWRICEVVHSVCSVEVGNTWSYVKR